MTPQELKNSILQLAIQGKLVPQRAEEGSAEELYKQIQAEKKKLIKEKKIKKEQPLPEISDEEKPFDIPETWKWVRLGDSVFNHGQILPNFDFSYIDIGSINNKKNCLNANEVIIKPENAPSRARKIVQLGDILYSTVRPYLHNICVIDKKFKCTPIASTGFAVMCCYTGLYNKYLFYYLLSPTFDYYANDVKNAKGVAYPAINDKRLYNAIVPIPPLSEQKRIVAKIEELLPYVEQYEKAYNELQELDKRLPGDLQKSILQLAIQGRLIPQRAEEGNAEELYKQIQAEKKKLIKEKKIKKEKPLPEITDEEKPFDIPETWKWVRLGEVVSNLGDGIHGTPEFDLNGNYFFINGNNLDNGNIVIKSDTKRISHTEYEKHKKPLNNNTILISINGTIGNYAFYNNEPIILGKSACYISLLKLIYKYYILYLFKTKFFYDYAVKEATQTTIKNVSLKAMRMLPIPLPPLAEQKRIVAKLEGILPLCDKLK